MSKHTPGPWKVVRDRGNHWGMVEVCGPGVSGRLIVGFTVATDTSAGQAATTVADAELIAAAPDLLAACQAAMRIEALWCPAATSAMPNPDEAIALEAMRSMFVAAIAKAGATP